MIIKRRNKLVAAVSAAAVALTCAAALFSKPVAVAEGAVNMSVSNPKNSYDYVDLQNTSVFSAAGKVALIPTAGKIRFTDYSNHGNDTLLTTAEGGDIYGGQTILDDVALIGEDFALALTHTENQNPTTDTNPFDRTLYCYGTHVNNFRVKIDTIQSQSGVIETKNFRKLFVSPDAKLYAYSTTGVYRIIYTVTNETSIKLELSASLVAGGLTLDTDADFAVDADDKVFYTNTGKLNLYDKTAGTTTVALNGLDAAGDIKAVAVNADSVYVSNGVKIAKFNKSNIGTPVAVTPPSGAFAPVNAVSLALLFDSGEQSTGQTRQIFALDTTARKILVFDDAGNSIKGSRSISTSGADSDKFDNPRSLAVSPDGRNAYVADSGNSRISVISMAFATSGKDYDTISTIINGAAYNPTAIACDDKYIYAACDDNTLLCFVAASRELKVMRADFTPSNYRIVDMRVSNGVLFIAESADNGTHRVRSIEKPYEQNSAPSDVVTAAANGIGNPLAIALNTRGTKLYVAVDTGVEIFDTAAKTKIGVISFAESGAGTVSTAGMDVDYAGNIFIADTRNGARITRISRTENGYAPAQSYALKCTLAQIDTLSAIAVSSDGVCAALCPDKNLLLYSKNSELGAIGKNGSRQIPAITGTVVCKIEIAAQIRYDLDNFEEYTDAPTGSLFLALAEKTSGGKTYYYGVFEDGFAGYVSKDVLKTLSPADETDMGEKAYALHPMGVQIYKYPFVTTDGTLDARNPVLETVGPETILTVLNNVAEDGGKQVWQTDKIKWYYVQYENSNGEIKNGYVIKNQIAPNVPLTPPATKKTMKISAPEVNGTVDFYMFPDLASGVWMQLPDGAEVRLSKDFDPESEFTEVVFKNRTGYVLTKYLKSSGLTTGQIVAVVLSCVAVIVTAASVAFVVLYRKKKRHGTV